MTTLKMFTKAYRFIFLFFLIESCSTNTPEKTINNNTVKGYILTAEKIDNGYFINDLFYFFPADKIDSLKPLSELTKSLTSSGYGFSLYSSYYVRLINAMSTDLISYTIDSVKSDPYKLKIKFWKVLPVNVVIEYNTKGLNQRSIITDSLLIYNGTYVRFNYNYLGHAKINSLEILLNKKDDLSGNEAMLPFRKDGIWGNIKKIK